MVRSISGMVMIAIAAGSLMVGCGKAKRPNELAVYPVKGRFTRNGEPMSYAVVTFFPTGTDFASSLKSRANCDQDGNFELTTYELKDGAPVGEYQVVLYWPMTKPDPDAMEAPDPPDKLMHAYSDPKKSKLTATVKDEPNFIEFKLP